MLRVLYMLTFGEDNLWQVAPLRSFSLLGWRNGSPTLFSFAWGCVGLLDWGRIVHQNASTHADYLYLYLLDEVGLEFIMHHQRWMKGWRTLGNFSRVSMMDNIPDLGWIR